MAIAFLSLPTSAAKAISKHMLVLLPWPVLVPAGDEQPVDVIRSATDNVLSELYAAPEIRNDPAKLSCVIQAHIVAHVDVAAGTAVQSIIS